MNVFEKIAHEAKIDELNKIAFKLPAFLTGNAAGVKRDAGHIVENAKKLLGAAKGSPERSAQLGFLKGDVSRLVKNPLVYAPAAALAAGGAALALRSPKKTLAQKLMNVMKKNKVATGLGLGAAGLGLGAGAIAASK